MKSFIALASICFLAAVLCAPPGGNPDSVAQITTYESNNIGTPDGYGFQYGTSNGINAQEEGKLKNVGSENEALEVKGRFSYTGPDGVFYEVIYTADEGGFQASGAHLPKPV